MKTTTSRFAVAIAAVLAIASPTAGRCQESYVSEPRPRQGHALVADGRGRLHLLGGNDGARLLWEHWIYDTLRGGWERKDLPAEVEPLNSLEAVCASGKIVVVGSRPRPISAGRMSSQADGPRESLDSVYVLDPESDSWSVHRPRITPSERIAYAIAALADGRILLFGGETLLPAGWKDLDDTWLLDPASWTWSPATGQGGAEGPVGRRLAVMGAIGGGAALLTGGSRDEDVLLADSWIFDPAKNGWKRVEGAGPPPFLVASGVSLPEGSFLLQRQAADGAYPGDLWRFDAVLRSWRTIAPPADLDARIGPLAAVGDGIWIFSGSREEELYIGLETFRPEE